MAYLLRQKEHLGRRILRFRLGQPETSALNIRIFVPFWDGSNNLEFKEAKYHCIIVKFW
jgi:hypothetical protein